MIEILTCDIDLLCIYRRAYLIFSRAEFKYVAGEFFIYNIRNKIIFQIVNLLARVLVSHFTYLEVQSANFASASAQNFELVSKFTS